MFNKVSLMNELCFNINSSNNIPTFLKNYSAQEVGCPNCIKDDALYIETRKGGVIRKWRIEPNKSKINDISTQKYIDSLDIIIQAM